MNSAPITHGSPSRRIQPHLTDPKNDSTSIRTGSTLTPSRISRFGTLFNDDVKMSYNAATRSLFEPLQNSELMSNQQCAICLNSYGSSHAPVRLSSPCQHVFGHGCLKQWISSHQDNSNTCPICRHVLFESYERERVNDMFKRERNFAGRVIGNAVDYCALMIGGGLLYLWGISE
ncbi:hypothetical protein CC78DRAFT_585626 [Lojkania enalia]|uniref:RING-type domain-containing protein n=1 Tax=Lojkania enalia TaxID=147567 RepID=A0A9P4N5R7_9PLEO|nr:hypothetical protein CC78DRAFT_585626 [Didymosphaeria enalia]